MHIVALSGSPRRGGNSETLLDSAVEGALSAGATVSKIVISELRIQPCENCGGCDRSGRCVQKDDMDRIYDELSRADAIIVATPIFFGSVTAQLKAVIDRCQPLWVRRYLLKQKPEKERRVLFLCVGGFKKHDELFKLTERVIRIWLLVLGAKLWRSLFYAGVDRKGAIREHPSALREAFEAGRALVVGEDA